MFWQMAPCQIELLLERHKEHERALDRRAGEIAARVVNASPMFNRKKYPEGITWLDVFPEHREPAPQQTEDQMFQTMLLWAKATEGRGGGLST